MANSPIVQDKAYFEIKIQFTGTVTQVLLDILAVFRLTQIGGVLILFVNIYYCFICLMLFQIKSNFIFQLIQIQTCYT